MREGGVSEGREGGEGGKGERGGVREDAVECCVLSPSFPFSASVSCLIYKGQVTRLFSIHIHMCSIHSLHH